MVDVGAVLRAVPDPELPFLTIADLGILRGWDVDGDRVRVRITPTYSGCPAMDVIREDVEKALRDNGFRDVTVETVLSPAWTTDWLSERGRAALAEHGIAPPGPTSGPVPVTLGDLSGPPRAVARSEPDSSGMTCPRCGSRDTVEQSRFGSTACKALWRCRGCAEPFEHFKAY